MILLAIALSVSPNVPPAQTEHELYREIQKEKEELPWPAPTRLQKDLWKSEACYIRFHLGFKNDCTKETDRFETDFKAWQTKQVQ